MFKLICILLLSVTLVANLTEGKVSQAHKRDLRYLSKLRSVLLRRGILGPNDPSHVILARPEVSVYFRVIFPINCDIMCSRSRTTRKLIGKCKRKGRPFACMYCRLVVGCDRRSSSAPL